MVNIGHRRRFIRLHEKAVFSVHKTAEVVLCRMLCPRFCILRKGQYRLIVYWDKLFEYGVKAFLELC